MVAFERFNCEHTLPDFRQKYNLVTLLFILLQNLSTELSGAEGFEGLGQGKNKTKLAAPGLSLRSPYNTLTFMV